MKDIRDRAIALETYARQARNSEDERRCREIRQRAEREFGRRYKASLKPLGTRGQVSVFSGVVPGALPEETETPTLKRLGVSGHQAADWQRVADLPDDEFETALAGGASTSDMVEMATNKETRLG